MARPLRGVCSSDSCVLPLANTFLCLLVKAVVHPSHDLLISPMPLHLSLHLCGDRKNTSLYMPLPLSVCLSVCLSGCVGRPLHVSVCLSVCLSVCGAFSDCLSSGVASYEALGNVPPQVYKKYNCSSYSRSSNYNRQILTNASMFIDHECL